MSSNFEKFNNNFTESQDLIDKNRVKEIVCEEKDGKIIYDYNINNYTSFHEKNLVKTHIYSNKYKNSFVFNFLRAGSGNSFYKKITFDNTICFKTIQEIVEYLRDIINEAYSGNFVEILLINGKIRFDALDTNEYFIFPNDELIQKLGFDISQSTAPNRIRFLEYKAVLANSKPSIIQTPLNGYKII